MQNFNRVLSIGYGNMGRAFIQPITNHSNTSLTVLTQKSLPLSPPQNTTQFSDLSEIEKKPFDLIVFACRDYQIDQVMGQIQNKDLFNQETLFVSIIENLEREYFYNKLGEKSKVALMSPNLAIKLGKGIVSVLYEQKLPVFDYLGRLVYVKTEEDFRKINAMVGATASSAVYHILQSYKKACEDDDMSLNVNKELTNFNSNLKGSQVESENMDNLTLDLFEGAIEFYKQEKNPKMEELKQRVMTENGVAAEGMKKLDGMDKIFLDMGKDFVERSKK